MVAVLVLIPLCVGLMVALPPAAGPWAQLAVTALVASWAVARIQRSSPGPRRRTVRRVPVDVVDLIAPDRSCVGCVDGTQVATTAVEVSAGSLLTTEAGRDDPAEFHGVRLPLAAIARQVDQGGVTLDGIDVVVRGRRAAPGDDGEVYSSLVGPLALISRRRVHLLIRFDLTRLATTVGAEDGSLERVVTVATERLRRTLIHHGVPCRVLDAAELAGLYLAAEHESAEGAGLLVRPGQDARNVLDALWAVHATEVTEVLRLRPVAGRGDLVDTVASMGLSGVEVAAIPARAAVRCRSLHSAGVLPVPGEPLPRGMSGALVRRSIAGLDALAPPAHGCGQVLGATRSGAASTIQLAGPHLRLVLLAARPAVCRQVVFRAVAAGYRVAVVTDVPNRWRPLLAIDDESRYRIIDPDSSDAGAPVDAVVWDVDGPLSEGRIDALAGPGGPDVTPPTVIRVDADWDLRPSSGETTPAKPDLVLDGRIDGWISVEPRGSAPHRVTVVEGPGEEAYVGPLHEVTRAGAAPSAIPDRR